MGGRRMLYRLQSYISKDLVLSCVCVCAQKVYPGRYSMHKNAVLVGVRTHFNTVSLDYFFFH